MEVTSSAKYLRISPKKVLTLAKKIETLSAQEALTNLKFAPKKAASPLAKAIKAAVSDAKNNFKLPHKEWTIKRVEVQEGPRLKRVRARSRGMTHPILKRTTHIKLILQD